MGVNNRQMTIDAKLKHIKLGPCDRSGTTGVGASGLYDPDRRIRVVKAFYEVTEQHVTADGTYTIGKVGATAEFAAAFTVAQASVLGTMGEITLKDAAKDVAKQTLIRPYWTNNANAGQVDIHLFYYMMDQSNAMEIA